MRNTNLIFVLACFLTGCGSTGDLYLPSGEKSQVDPVSIQDTIEYGTDQQEEDDR